MKANPNYFKDGPFHTGKWKQKMARRSQIFRRTLKLREQYEDGPARRRCKENKERSREAHRSSLKSVGRDSIGRKIGPGTAVRSIKLDRIPPSVRPRLFLFENRK